MDSLKREVDEMLTIFDDYQIPEGVQRFVMTGGIYFYFSQGHDRPIADYDFDCFKFARFLKFCRNNGIDFDANRMINDSCNPEYQELVNSFDKLDNILQGKKKKKTR